MLRRMSSTVFLRERQNVRMHILACDEADELGHTLLNSLLGVLRDFGVGRKCLFHNPTDICDGQKTVLLANVSPLGSPLVVIMTPLTIGTLRVLLRHYCPNRSDGQQMARAAERSKAKEFTKEQA